MKPAELLKSCEAWRDRDRERISKILHDDTGGQLMALAAQLELLRMDGVKGLEPALAALDRAFESVRVLSRDVHPNLVELVGLPGALRDLANSARKRFGGELRLAVAEGATGSPDMYRIAEELVDNAIRHSKSSTILLFLTQEGELIVEDNGVGFQPRLAAKGLGLWRVRRWAQRAGLRMRLRSGPESGTIIRVTQSHAI